MALSTLGSIAVFVGTKASELFSFIAYYISPSVPVILDASASATVNTGDISEQDRRIISIILSKSSEDMVLPSFPGTSTDKGVVVSGAVSSVSTISGKPAKVPKDHVRKVVFNDVASKVAAAPLPPAAKTNMAAVKDVVSLYQLLKAEWAKKPVNLEKCGELLTKLKVGLTTLMFLPTSNTSATQQELLLARDILEIGAQWSIAVKDIPSFERYMAQLKCYYLDYRHELPESAYKYQLLGLNLLFLLSQNRVAEFHTELELLPSDQIQSNAYIRHPLCIEQYLMEGSYNKIFLAKGNVPAESYYFFMDILLDTIRNEIAACLEKAYEKISLKEATRMLYLANQQAIKEYGLKRKWTLGKDNFYYFKAVETKTDNVLPSSELAEQAINYARELEMIV